MADSVKTDARIYFYGGDDEQYAAVYTGTVEYDDDAVHIEYMESDNTRTLLSVIGEIVTLNRIGEMVYTLILEKDKPYTFAATTQFGQIPLSVLPTLVETAVTPQTVDIRLHYDMTVADHQSPMRFLLKCDIS